MENICDKNISLNRNFFKYAIPSILGMLIVSFQIIIDGIFVSRGVGESALAAINLTMPIVNFQMSLTLMICVGGVVIVGITKGSKKEKEARGLTSLTLLLLVSTLALVSLIIIFNLERVLEFLGTDKEIYLYVKEYLKIMVLGSILFNSPIFTETFVRVMGKPNQVFISGLICFLGNIILDYFFIFKINLGISGAGYATILANFLGALALISKIKFGKIEKEMLPKIKTIFFNGSSEMLTTLASAVAIYLFNRVLLDKIGVMGVTAMTIVYYINSILGVTLYGVSQALQPLVAYNLGAKDLRKIKGILKISLLTGGSIGAITFILVQVFNEEIVRVFSEDKNLVEIAKEASFYISFSYLFSFFNIVVSSFETAIERPIESAVISLCRSIIFIALPLFILPIFLGNSGIWLTLLAAEVMTLFITLPIVVKGLKRLKNRLGGKKL